MLINSNRIADGSLIIKDLDFFSTDQVKDMERNDNWKNSERKDVLAEKRSAPILWEGKSTATHVKNLHKLQQLLRVLGFSLAIFGMFHLDNLFGKKCAAKEAKERKPRSRKFQLHSIYCYVVVALFFAYFVRSILAFFVGKDAKENFAFRIVLATWSLQILMNVCVTLKASHPRWGYQGVACRNWDSKVLGFMESLDVGLHKKKIQKILKLILIIGWCTVALNLCLMPLLLFQNNSAFGDAMANVLMAPIPVNTYTKLATMLLSVFQTVAWIVPVMYLMAVCFVVSAAFKVCKAAVSTAIDKGEETNTYPTCLYRERMLHLNISRCLELIDKDFKYLYANMFFTNIPLACFILYQMLKTSMDPLNLAAFSIWLAVNVVFVAMATLAGASVNSAVSIIK